MDRIKESAYIESIYTKLKDALDLRKFKVEKVYMEKIVGIAR